MYFVNVYRRLDVRIMREIKTRAKVHHNSEKRCGKSKVGVESLEIRCVICIFHT